MKKGYVKIVLTLTTVSVMSGLLLSVWSNVTAERVRINKENEMRESLAEISPQTRHYAEKNSDAGIYYEMKKSEADENPSAVIFLGEGNGFQGKIRMLLGVDPEKGEIMGIKILEQSETPGLGTKIMEDKSNKGNPGWFLSQFRGKKTDQTLVVTKKEIESNEEIHAISGATISSRAVTKIVNGVLEKRRDTQNGK